MAQDKAADRDKLLADAWARWREADYSWEGLLGPDKEANGFESRQHYWRTDPETGEVRDDAALIDAGELIVVEGQKTYHLAHLPLHYEDGTPTAKTTTDTAEALHERLITVITARLKAASLEDAPTAMLQGIVTGDLLELTKLRIDCLLRVDFSCALFANIRFDGSKFSGEVNFHRATFYNKSNFIKVIFLDDAYFGNANFFGDTSFEAAKFSGCATFDETIFFKKAIFYKSNFTEEVSFSKACFSDAAEFGGTDFSKSAEFNNTTFIDFASFGTATFLEKASFDNAKFYGFTDFGGVNFSSAAHFRGAMSSHAINFTKAKMHGEANFSEINFFGLTDFDSVTFFSVTNFTIATFSGEVKFNNAEFSEYSYFSLCKFLRNASFKTVTFFDNVRFSDATFSEDAIFEKAIFSKDALFDRANFLGSARFNSVNLLGEVNYREARFQSKSDFVEIKWPKNTYMHHMAFFNTTFDALVNFSGSGFRAFAAFDGAIFKQGLRFDKIERSEGSEQRRFEAQARSHFNRELAACKDASLDRLNQEQRLEELENGCRLLKQEMIKQGDKSREQILYKFELLARRAQKSTALSEKALSYLYGWFSDYGGSALRPLVWLVGIWLGFSLLFSTFLFSVSPPRPVPAPVALVAPASPNGSCKDALHLPAKASDLLPLSLSVSASRIFPFGAFEDVSKRLVSAYDCEGYTGRALGFRLLATVESFLALTLAFLFGLAVRRRFQIS